MTNGLPDGKESLLPRDMVNASGVAKALSVLDRVGNGKCLRKEEEATFIVEFQTNSF